MVPVFVRALFDSKMLFSASIICFLHMVLSEQPPRITFEDLREALEKKISLDELKDDGGKLGAFVITEVPDYDENMIEEFRKKAPNCIGSNEALPQFELSDGSLRRTFATLGTSVYPACMGKSLNKLSDGFSEVGVLVSELISRISETYVYIDNDNNKTVELKDAPTKDHVHIYKGRETKTKESHPDDESSYLVPYHIDNGLYLTITPFPGHGLRLRTSSGLEVSTDDLPAASILILIGRAITDWLFQEDPTNREKFWAVPHSVPTFMENPEIRSVFARMKIVPMRATPVGGSTTFKKIFTNNDKMTIPKSKESQVCSVNMNDVENGTVSYEERNSWLKMMDAQCKAGEAYCWMSCRPLNPKCGMDLDKSICYSTKNNLSCTTEINGHPMDPSCRWECRSDVINTQLYPNEYCNGRMDMLMTGFEVQGRNRGNPCIILFVEAWTLDSRTKFIVACFGVMFIGIIIEGIIAFRRNISSRKSRFFVKFRYRTRRILLIACFGLNLTLGYLAMLVAMTYSFELFCCVIVGLIIGHAVFNVSAGVSESVDPCCAAAAAAAGNNENYCRDLNGDTYPFTRAPCEEAMPSILNREENSSVPCCSTGSEKESMIDTSLKV